ncbi:MAG: SpoIIE family protein phosphatase [Deltaproteobacteria bacterium]|nr:SpoIIE family protein phosphatase [Deltaproteobacteria bacterium]
MRIQYRLLLGLIPAMLSLFGALAFFGLKDTERTVLAQITREVYELSRAQSMEFEFVFETGRQAAEGLAGGLEAAPAGGERFIHDLIKGMLKRNPDIYGSTVATVPGENPLGTYAPYYYRKNKNDLAYQSLAVKDYSYQWWDWFRQPLKSGKSVWGEPYFDEGGGNVLMTTYSTPVKTAGRVTAIATADISLAHLVKRVQGITVGKTGYAFIVTATGRLVAHPEKGIISERPFWEEKFADSKFVAELREILKEPQAKGGGEKIEHERTPSRNWVVKTSIPATGWTLVVWYPRDELLSPMIELRQKMAVVAALIMAGIVFYIMWISSMMSSPISKLVDQARHYAMGDYSEVLDTKRGAREIRELSGAFNALGEAVVSQLKAVEKETSQKERYLQELQIAAEIQKDILPTQFPPFPELAEKIDIYAIIKPATEVGGDFYDFFRLPGEKIGFLVADVAGKGAPSAFFMAMARILVREFAKKTSTPEEVIRRVNMILQQDNASCNFVTMLYGEMDLGKGRGRFVCAGHNSPVLVTADGQVKELPVSRQAPLGAVPGVYYESTPFNLNPGETLVLYTDGVTEAMNGERALFGNARLTDSLLSVKSCDSRSLANNLLASVKDFTGDAAQNDDITVLCVGRPTEVLNRTVQFSIEETGPVFTMEIPASLSSLAPLFAFTAALREETGLSEDEMKQVNLALEETVVNVIDHAYGGRSDNRMEVTLGAFPGGIRVIVTDFGRPFDFENKRIKYDGKADINQPVGGIGLFLMQKVMDSVHYEPATETGNRMIMLKRKKR